MATTKVEEFADVNLGAHFRLKVIAPKISEAMKAVWRKRKQRTNGGQQCLF